MDGKVFDYHAQKIPLHVKLLLLFQREKGCCEQSVKDNKDYSCVVFYKKLNGVIYITRTHYF
mgnify:CR=1 FL=1